MGMGLKKMKASRPGASSWDKLSARSAKDTIANRDVYEDQQLDRAKVEQMRSKRPVMVLGVFLAVLATGLIWIVYSVMAMAVSGFGEFDITSSGSSEYVAEVMEPDANGEPQTCYKQINEKGMSTGQCYDSAEEVPVPDWYAAEHPEADGTQPQETDETSGALTLREALFMVSAMKVMLSLGGGLMVAVVLGTWASKNIDAENTMRDTADINPYQNDQHISTPDELLRKFDYFPDAGAHSSVQVSSLISHVMLRRKGLKKVQVAKRAESEILDEDGNVRYYEGEVLDDEEGEPIFETKPLIDEEFGEDLFEASNLPNAKLADGRPLRRRFDATVVPYNPDGKDRDKLGDHKRVSDLINDDWNFPEYERQRPAGAYLVDTAPVNTMVLAMTRAGKGQTYIEPTVDMWSREDDPSNMLLNDPKGELLVKFYTPLVMRGFEPIQFNLINSMKTDICNPLGLPVDAAREGDETKCAQYVENISDTFYPLEGGEDPVWPQAAANAFKRAVYGLIDFYMEEERELRDQAVVTKMDPEALDQRLDDTWGHVTLYNCYQLFVQLSSKKVKNPEAELEKRVKAGEFDDDEDGLELESAEAKSKAFLWGGKAELDMLTLYFNATEALPTNTIRSLVSNADRALRAMADAEKMLASVYGIAITAMSFFTDPTIASLTSGKPSQNTDLGGLSFPRRFGVRFAINYMTREHFKGLQVLWSAYNDSMFTENLGPDFEHSDIITNEGWGRYYFKGIFPNEQAWIKLEVVNPQTKMLVRTFYFNFKKSHQVSLTGRHFVVEPVTSEKQIKNGVLREMHPVREGDKADGAITGFRFAETTYPQDGLDLTGLGDPERVTTRAQAITQMMVRYSEKPKAIFLITPPHLTPYAKLILIIVKQLVDLNFDKSYMTKSNQKPLYKTRFMLDELGNLQSDGHGIGSFETLLSIGLGQEQQFTLILQTLQQLREVYGESVDKIVQGNVSNIVFLKSTDDSMLETLEKLSGTTHNARTESKQVTRNVKKLALKNEGAISYTMSTKEEPLIKMNDMLFIGERNSMVFRAGDAPVWNRNEMILPMSWRLMSNSLSHPGHEYSLQTIPTLSSAMEFDVRKNQPNFSRMLDKRMKQAVQVETAERSYREAFGITEADVALMDPNLYSDQIMELVQKLVNVTDGLDPHAMPEMDSDDLANSMIIDQDAVIENTEVNQEVAVRGAEAADRKRLVYAEGTVSKEMLTTPAGAARIKSLDRQISEAYKQCLSEIARDHQHFSLGGDDELRSADGSKVYITPARSQTFVEEASKLNGSASNGSSRVFSEADITPEDLESLVTMEVHADFYQFLASLPTWEHLADGTFDRAMAQEMTVA